MIPKLSSHRQFVGKLIYGDLLFMAKAPDTLRGEFEGRTGGDQTRRERTASTISAMKAI